MRRVRESAFSGLRQDPDRVGLVYVTGTMRAMTALDVALVASEAEIAEFTELAFPAEFEPGAEPLSVEQLGWHLEREALRYMAVKYGDATLSPELRGVLLRHVGEAGRFPGMLTDAVNACGNRDQLVQRLIAENRLFLEDSDPSARVRAYDWLRLQGVTPEGYDPLASRDERRAALELEHDRMVELARERAEQEREQEQEQEQEP